MWGGHPFIRSVIRCEVVPYTAVLSWFLRQRVQMLTLRGFPST
jgi:hypothetical protein